MAEYKGVQLEILTSKDSNQLVSAGAGSGKTTIMIQKIMNLIFDENVPVENLLVVTFTVLAAKEMKDRLIEKLNEQLKKDDSNKERILTIIEKIKTASIDTIDGFASKTIKKYFYDLEISPNIEILSDASRDYYLSIAMKKTMEVWAKREDELQLMLDLYGGGRRNLKTLEDLIVTHYYNVMNIEDYEEFISCSLNEYIDPIKSENIINNYICTNVDKVKQKIKYNYSAMDQKIQEKLSKILNYLNNFDKNLNLRSNLKYLINFEYEIFSTKEKKENIGLKELSNSIKEIDDIRKKFLNLGISLDFDEKNKEIIKILSIFLKMLTNFIENYNNLKIKNNFIDFNDLNRLMLKLLKNDKIRSELQEKYKYIFLDEYQDVSPLQDGLLSKVVGKDAHVFMVGDVKQSIYGFRGASPEWFLTKYNNFKSHKDQGSAYDMNVNFRSSPTILNFINDIFSHLMTKTSADIDYVGDCMIDPQRLDIVDDKVKVLLVEESEKSIAKDIYSVKEHKQKNILSTTEKEAVIVSQIISNLVGRNFYDSKTKQTRPLTYKDIAILSRSEKDDSAKILINILKECSIPLSINNKLVVNESEGVRLIMSILKTVTGMADDVDYLATFLALTNLDIDYIMSIRDNEKPLYQNLIEVDNIEIAKGFGCIEDIRSNSYVMTNSELIRYILEDKKLRYFILQKKEGEKELKLIEEFLSKLSSIEDGLSLAEFVEVVESSVSKGTDFETSDDDDSVTFETIHKSKGLEYPVVILYNSSKEFSYIRDHEGINFDSELGFGMDYFDVLNRQKTFSLTKYAIKLKNNEKGYKEELRLLYVALTRAKNKLYITGRYKPKDIEEKEVKKTSFANCILDCFVDQLSKDTTELKNCIIELIDEEIDLINREQTKFSKITRIGEGFVYPNQNKFDISFKNTVTGINSERSNSIEFSTKKWLTPDMQYESTEDKAKIGTDYHKALELLDLSSKYVQNTDFETVDYKKIELAHQVLSTLVKPGDSIRKEADFMMYLPYRMIVNSEVDDKVLVQGVVDLIIDHGESIDIVDYKFSTLPIKILKKKYTEQLSLYKQAVEKAYKKKVNNTYIYSINTGELY